MNTAQYFFDSHRRLLGDSSAESYMYHHQYLSLCLTIITMVVIVFMLLIASLYYCFFSRLNRFPDHQQNHDHHATTSRQANHQELEAITVFTYGTMTLPSTMLPECEICAICLDEYVQEDAIWVLRRCKHMFHKDCIDEWMRRRSLNCICPICRVSMIEQSVEVPGTSCGFGAAVCNNTHPLMSITFANNAGRPSNL